MRAALLFLAVACRSPSVPPSSLLAARHAAAPDSGRDGPDDLPDAAPAAPEPVPLPATPPATREEAVLRWKQCLAQKRPACAHPVVDYQGRCLGECGDLPFTPATAACNEAFASDLERLAWAAAEPELAQCAAAMTWTDCFHVQRYLSPQEDGENICAGRVTRDGFATHRVEAERSLAQAMCRLPGDNMRACDRLQWLAASAPSDGDLARTLALAKPAADDKLFATARAQCTASRASTDCEDLETYVELFPRGRHRAEAKALLARLADRRRALRAHEDWLSKRRDMCMGCRTCDGGHCKAFWEECRKWTKWGCP